MIHPDYSCYTVVGEFQGTRIWEHRVVTKDRKRAITINYSPDVKRITPPIYHFHDPDADCAEGLDDCDVVDAPCVANIGLLDIFEMGAMNQDHSGETDPGVTFWTMMIRRLDSYSKEPIKYEYSDEDAEQDPEPQVQDGAACNGSGQSVGSDQAGSESDAGSDRDDLQRKDGPSNGNGGHWQAPSGTIRTLH